MYPNHPYQPQPPPSSRSSQPPNSPPLSRPLNAYTPTSLPFITRPDPRVLCTPTTPEGRATRERLLATMHLLPPMPNAVYMPAPCEMFGLVKGKTPEQIERKRKEEEKGKKKQGGVQNQAKSGVYPTGGPLAPLPCAWQDPGRPATLPADFYAYRDKGV